MKFNDKFPDKVNPQKVYPERLMGPHPEIEVEPGLIQSWRIYPCTCGAPTGWRNVLADDFPPAPCCSEECMVELKACLPTKENLAVNAAVSNATSTTEVAGLANEPETQPGPRPTPTRSAPRIEDGTQDLSVEQKPGDDAGGLQENLTAPKRP